MKLNGAIMSEPTAAQRRRWGRVAALGCLPCRMDGYFGTPATISHCHDYGYRDHDKVYPCCPVHHLATEAIPGIPNRHATPEAFRNKFGTDEELHKLTKQMLGEI